MDHGQFLGTERLLGSLLPARNPLEREFQVGGLSQLQPCREHPPAHRCPQALEGTLPRGQLPLEAAAPWQGDVLTQMTLELVGPGDFPFSLYPPASQLRRPHSSTAVVPCPGQLPP